MSSKRSLDQLSEPQDHKDHRAHQALLVKVRVHRDPKAVKDWSERKGLREKLVSLVLRAPPVLRGSGRNWYHWSSGRRRCSGAQGETGITGPQGAAGAQGLTGAQGSQGVQGATGSQGAAGAQGSAGTQVIESFYLVTSDYGFNPLNEERAFLVDASTGPVIFALCPAASFEGKQISVKKVDGTQYPLRIRPQAGEQIEGRTGDLIVSSRNAGLVLRAINGKWYIF